MTAKILRRLLALMAVVLVPLSACAPSESAPNPSENRDALIWANWNGYQNFFDLLGETYPDIELEISPYAGSNRTGYSWAQMRGDDIPDVFITSQILDEELAAQRLVDLSGYDFISNFSTPVLDQVAIDGGIYLLPVNYGMYGTFYNKTLMEEHGWEVPTNFAELEALCQEIQAAGLIPGVLGTQLSGNTFSAVFNLAKTSWLTTPAGKAWEQDFLAGSATAEGFWEDTMAYIQRLIDAGFFTVDPDDRNNPDLILDYLGNRKAVFFTAVMTVNITELPDSGDKLGMMPYIGEDGSKNIYMYSPTNFVGISKHLTEPGNEKKLEQAIQALSLLYSPEGQAAFISEETPCVLSVSNSSSLPEDALIYDAQQALREGRAFPMTYAHWDGVLADMGQVFKEWFRGDNGMDGPRCIARMDELQQSYLTHSEELYFCKSTADFTLEETAELLCKALGSSVGADAVIVPIWAPHHDVELRNGITGKLYQGNINTDIASSLLPAFDGEYALMTMTGAQAKELTQAGFDPEGDGNPFPYLLVTRGGAALEDNAAYLVAFFPGSYTEETGEAYSVQVCKSSLREILRTWLTAQKTVSPDGNPWE